MKLYFDTAYLARCYWNEPDGKLVRILARQAEGLYSSAICIAEMACVAHRKIREGRTSPTEAAVRRELFFNDLGSQAVTVVPMTERLLRRVDSMTRFLPASCYLRAADSIHLTTAVDEGFTEIWTNDRHILAATEYFGLRGRSVESS